MRPSKGKIKPLITIFGLGWLISFIGGCTARYAYHVYGNPKWLDALVFILGGLTSCFMSLTALASSFTYFWNTNSCEDKLKVVFAVFIGIPFFLLGVVGIWQGFRLLMTEAQLYW